MTKDKKKKKKSDRSASTLIDITQKKFRWSDYIAEKVIKGVAFLSITIIVLIFIFVFRESLPIFASQKTSQQTVASGKAAETQETYGEVTDQAVPEVQETYGEVTDQPAAGETQETYGDVTDTTTQSPTDKESYTVSAGSGFDDNQTALKSILTKDWVPVSEKPRYGILALIIGTLKITMIALLFAAPLAILAALYTASFASKRMKEIIKPTIELLAGFPSVVIGFFALMILATFLQDVFHYDTRLNSFVGGIAMGIAAIPIIFTITEDALTAVPKSFYEASLALGASKWQTAFFVILPAATPGIFAAVLLGIGRVFGETMIALMATGNAAQMGLNPFESVRTLAATIGAEMAEVVFGDTHYNVLFLIGSLLFIFTFVINAIAEFYVKGKLMKRIQGK
ncbi:MAG TPA: phosphate ABC transporter permease subunit PstC [Prolixibacteraceae bacterium]